MNTKDLSAEHLEDAARLVATRYSTLRGEVPCLPAKYEDASTIAAMLGELGDTAGVAAFQAGRLVGFMTGMILPAFVGKRSFYSPEWANGAEAESSRRIYEEMYRTASDRWIADGCAVHVVTLMTHDREALEAWRWLGFGLVAADGVRGLAPVSGGPTGLDVRQAGMNEAVEVTALGRALEQYMAGPPVFLIHEGEDYGAWLGQPNHAAWLAYQDGEAVGCLGLRLGGSGGCDIVQDEKTVGIILAYTREDARRIGVTSALVNQALAFARARGYQRCAVDWEPMNPPASRYWTKRFSPVCYSLMRWIDERIVARRVEPEDAIGTQTDWDAARKSDGARRVGMDSLLDAATRTVDSQGAK